MFGLTSSFPLVTAVILTVSSAALATDVLRGKIYNWLTAPALILGVGYSVWESGWSGLWGSMGGVFVGAVLLGWLFSIRMMGAGDVKLVMALGAWGGFIFALKLVFLSILIGGTIAAVDLFFKGRLFSLLKEVYRFLLSVFIRELVLEFPKVDRRLTMPFGVAIGISAFIILFGEPFKFLGI